MSAPEDLREAAHVAATRLLQSHEPCAVIVMIARSDEALPTASSGPRSINVKGGKALVFSSGAEPLLPVLERLSKMVEAELGEKMAELGLELTECREIARDRREGWFEPPTKLDS